MSVLSLEGFVFHARRNIYSTNIYILTQRLKYSRHGGAKINTVVSGRPNNKGQLS